MILAINTAQVFHELALLKDGQLLLERRWVTERKEVEHLVPLLQEMLEELELNKAEITQVAVVSGPGSFTGTRTGVVFANALAEGLGAELFSLDVFDLLVQKAALADPVLPVLFAGGLDAAIKWEERIHIGGLSAILASLPHGNLHLVSELPETLSKELHSIAHEKGWTPLESHELQSLGEALQTNGLNAWTRQEVVEVTYLRKPFITPSSNPWKQ